MATPNSYLSRYSQFQYRLALNPWAISASNPYAFNHQLSYASFPQPFSYSYLLPQHNFYPSMHSNSLVAGSFPAAPPKQTSAILRPEERSIGARNKI